MFLNFVTDFIQVCCCIAVVIFIFFVVSLISYSFHCFLLVDLFHSINVVLISNITPTSLFYIIFVTLAILYIRNYSLV